MNMEEGGIYRNAAGGVTPPISPQDNEVYCWTDGHLGYTKDGKHDIGHSPTTLNLVEYLGQAETDNGDGTTTKIVTIPVTMRNEVWEKYDVAAHGGTVTPEKHYLGIDHSGHSCVRPVKTVWPNCSLLSLTPKVDPYWATLADAIDAGECEIPSRAERLQISVTGYTRLDATEWPFFLGVLPELRLGTDIEIDLAAFRTWYAKRGEA